MVTEEFISQWRAEDGTVFATRLDAERYEAKEAIADILHDASAYGSIKICDAVETLVNCADRVISLLVLFAKK